MIGEKIFVTGIDTDAGKTYATAWLAKQFMAQGKSVITQKFIQTGNVDFSEDITRHRELMGISLLPEDLDHTTAPIIFTYPASAQLAAQKDGRRIDLSIVDRSSEILASRYDVVLIEGAGGLMDSDKIIAQDTKRYVAQYLKKHFPEAELLFVPVVL